MDSKVLVHEVKNIEEFIDCSTLDCDTLQVKIPADLQCFLKIKNIHVLKNIEFFNGKNSNAKVNCIKEDEEARLNFKALIEEKANFDVNFVDFSDNNQFITANLILLGDNSSSSWSASCLSSNKNYKKYNISFDHIGLQTRSVMNNYGVASGHSSLFFEGCSHIEKMSVNSSANQTAKIIIYDEKCRALANPVLKIDNNEIEANHAAAVGTLNEDHVFYLLSRGIDIKNARKLITMGYLTNIFKEFSEDDREYLEKLIGERI